jgi:anti-anti-sigma factor
MSAPKYVRAERDGDIVFITPLFTYATFTEPARAGEWAEVQTLLEAPETRHVVVDLGEIPYFGSTVLEWMTQLWKRTKTKGGHLAAIRPSPIGREVLQAARLERLWGIFDSREEALNWLQTAEEVTSPNQ